MNDALSADSQPLSEIELRQEEVIRRLDELNRRIEDAIRENSPNSNIFAPGFEQLDPEPSL